MPDTSANKWYEIYARKQIRSELGIDLIRTKDMNRLLVPNENGRGMRPLFKDGFTATDKQKELLYKHAQMGELFAISKKNNEAFQISEDRIRSVKETVEQEQKKISSRRRMAYRATRVVAGPVGFGLRVTKNLLNVDKYFSGSTR